MNTFNAFQAVGFMGKEECDEYNFNFDFDTKQEAIRELQQAAQVACEAIAKIKTQLRSAYRLTSKLLL